MRNPYFEHLMKISDKAWDEMMEDYDLLVANAPSPLARVLKQAVTPGLKEIRSRRHSRAIRLEREA